MNTMMCTPKQSKSHLAGRLGVEAGVQSEVQEGDSEGGSTS